MLTCPLMVSSSDFQQVSSCQVATQCSSRLSPRALGGRGGQQRGSSRSYKQQANKIFSCGSFTAIVEKNVLDTSAFSVLCGVWQHGIAGVPVCSDLPSCGRCG